MQLTDAAARNFYPWLIRMNARAGGHVSKVKGVPQNHVGSPCAQRRISDPKVLTPLARHRKMRLLSHGSRSFVERLRGTNPEHWNESFHSRPGGFPFVPPDRSNDDAACRQARTLQCSI
jgi:hypothetical protein